jgi:hypothetical protein
MSSSCKGLVADIAKCLRASPCMDEVRGQGRTFSDCLRAPEAVRVARAVCVLVFLLNHTRRTSHQSVRG